MTNAISIQTKKGTLEIDLTPRGRTMIDLMGLTTAADFRPWGCSFSSWLEEDQREISKAATAEAEAIARKLMKADCVALLTALGVFASELQKRNDLRLSVQIHLYGRWMPPHFINEKK